MTPQATDFQAVTILQKIKTDAGTKKCLQEWEKSSKFAVAMANQEPGTKNQD